MLLLQNEVLKDFQRRNSILDNKLEISSGSRKDFSQQANRLRCKRREWKVWNPEEEMRK